MSGELPLRRALIVAPGWIGDTLLAQPLFSRLRDKYPGVTLDAVAPAWTVPVLQRMPEIACVFPSGTLRGRLGLHRRLRQGRTLAAGGYDAAFVLPNSFKSALLPLFARIPLRIGYTGEARFGLINRRHRLDKAHPAPMAEHYAQLAEAPGSPVHKPLAWGGLRMDETNREAARERLGLRTDQPVIALCPGAEYGPAKRWPGVYFSALARALGELDYTVWLFGSDKDRVVGAAVAENAGARCVDLTGRTDLAAAIDLLSYARAVVSNDSGLMHVAAALGKPLVALYGSSSPHHTPPLSRSAELLWLGLPCSPCFQRVCPLGHFNCMKELLPAQVLDRLRKIA